MSTLNALIDLILMMMRVARESILRPRRVSTILVREHGAEAAWTSEPNQSANRTRAPERQRLVTRKVPDIVVTPTFKMVFLTVVALTVLSGLVEIALAVVWIKPTENQQEVFDGFGFAWRAGVGALFGLLGGKAT